MTKTQTAVTGTYTSGLVKSMSALSLLGPGSAIGVAVVVGDRVVIAVVVVVGMTSEAVTAVWEMVPNVATGAEFALAATLVILTLVALRIVIAASTKVPVLRRLLRLEGVSRQKQSAMSACVTAV